MPDYKEATVAGKTWQRCNQISINNRRNAPPSVTFSEERVTSLGDRELSEPVSLMGQNGVSMSYPFVPEETINLIHPVTGESLGQTVSQQELYVILFSLYMQKAADRDARVEAAQAAEAQRRAEAEARLAELSASMGSGAQTAPAP